MFRQKEDLMKKFFKILILDMLQKMIAFIDNFV